jgi:hypothetical protein
MFFSIFKIDFFPENWKNFLGLFRFWNYSWWSTLWPKRNLWGSCILVFKIVKKWFSFRLKNTKKSIFSIYIDFFQIFSLDLSFSPEETYLSENFACTSLFFTIIVFLFMVLIYRLKSPLDMDWVVQKIPIFCFYLSFV